LAEELNRSLPERFFAEPNVHFGIGIEVGTFKEHPGAAPTTCATGAQSHSRDLSSWSPPAPTMTVAFPIIEDIVEIAVFNSEGGPELVGAIEFVSPANKDRTETRDAFLAKCKAYLQQGIGLVIVDIVTTRLADLHSELLAALGTGVNAEGNVSLQTSGEVALQAASYRPLGRDPNASLEIWREVLSLERSLPTLPLWLRGGICLPLELEGSYERTRRGLRMESL